jgi:DNA topoisomerase-1
MPGNLLIVESPGKIKKLRSFLGPGWRVAASVGHVRDLPEREMGITLPDFRPVYEPTDRGRGVLAKLAEEVKSADAVFLATDPDREGEAIAWHLKEALKLKNPSRVTFTSITENEVKGAIKSPRALDVNLIRAQTARRILDRFCGYLVSGPLSRAAGKRLSAGRVQSPALRLVVEKERAIREFVVVTHFGAELMFNGGWKAVWEVKNWLQAGGEYLLDAALAGRAADIRALTADRCDEKVVKVPPPAPFTTSSLQQAASNALKLTPKKTMELAQKLYETGHITYMRTDSPNIAPEALAEIRKYCARGNLPLSDKARVWKSKEGAQEAHEAIRPTHIAVEDAGESPDEVALYRLIRIRTLASQLTDAEYAVRTVLLSSPLNGKSAVFNATGRTLAKPGWKTLLAEDAATADREEGGEGPANPVPRISAGSAVQAVDGKVLQKKTRPPERYTEAALVRELEKRGIGRPSTYAAILETIARRGYVETVKRKLQPTELGETAVEYLSGSFSFADYGFTRDMEAYLDDLAEGKAVYREVLSKAYERLTAELDAFAKSHHDAARNGPPAPTAFVCTACGKPLVHMRGQRKDGSGEYNFFACSDRDCGMTYSNNNDEPGEGKKKHAPSEFKCKACGKPLVLRDGKKGKFFGCSGYPVCKKIYWERDGKPQKPGKKH